MGGETEGPGQGSDLIEILALVQAEAPGLPWARFPEKPSEPSTARLQQGGSGRNPKVSASPSPFMGGASALRPAIAGQGLCGVGRRPLRELGSSAASASKFSWPRAGAGSSAGTPGPATGGRVRVLRLGVM